MKGSGEAGRMTPSRAVLVLGGCGFAGLYLLFAVVPVLASRSGGRVGAGLATAVFMGATVLVQAAMPYIMARVRPHVLLGVSLLLLGAPTLLYIGGSSFVVILTATAVRGVGFGIVTVVAAALISAYTPPDRRGSALGTYGLATSFTGMAAPPLGLLLLTNHWETQTYLLAVLIPLAPLGLLTVVRRASGQPFSQKGSAAGGLRSVWREKALLTPVLLYFPCALAYGGLYTFLPLWSGDAPTGLLLYGCGFAIARFVGGRLADAVAPDILAVPLLGIVAVSTATTMVFPTGIGLAVSALVAGLGVGGMATVSLVSVMRQAGDERFALASTLWNLVFDLGIALGGFALGVVAQLAGYRAVFAVSAAGVTVALGAAVLRLTQLRTRRARSKVPCA